MKKKNLNTLHLQKSTISSLNTQAITGGTMQTIEDACPKPDKTHTTCSQLAKCDSKEICSANCKPTQDDALPVG